MEETACWVAINSVLEHRISITINILLVLWFSSLLYVQKGMFAIVSIELNYVAIFYSGRQNIFKD